MEKSSRYFQRKISLKMEKNHICPQFLANLAYQGFEAKIGSKINDSFSLMSKQYAF